MDFNRRAQERKRAAAREAEEAKHADGERGGAIVPRRPGMRTNALGLQKLPEAANRREDLECEVCIASVC
jgi:hypothetical protein